MDKRPKAYVLAGEGIRIGRPGRTVFHDLDSGMILSENWTGFYLYYIERSPSLMRTWFDPATGERAFSCEQPNYQYARK